MRGALVAAVLVLAACGGDGSFMSDDVTALMTEVDDAFEAGDAEAVCDGMQQLAGSLDEWASAAGGNMATTAHEVRDRLPMFRECTGLGDPSELDLDSARNRWQTWVRHARDATVMKNPSSRIWLYIIGLIALFAIGMWLREYVSG